MAARPNLFRLEPRDVAENLYASFVARTLYGGKGDPEGAVKAIRSMRAHARSTCARLTPGFLRSFEAEALAALGRFEAAWRTVCAERRERWPTLAAKPVARRIARMAHFVGYAEAPAAYFSGRLRTATEALESYLDWQLDNGNAYTLHMKLESGDPQPSSLVGVTLAHIYAATGRTLGDWPRWKDWVSALHPRLLTMCQLDAPSLIARPALMSVFHDRLRALERERRSHGYSFGQRDLLEPKRKALARQKDMKRQLQLTTPENERRQRQLAQKRARYFPELEP